MIARIRKDKSRPLLFWVWLAAAAVLGGMAPGRAAVADQRDAFAALDRYIRAIYARDYHEAYRLISSRDQRSKDRRAYVRDRGAFSGFTLQAARKLASYIEWQAVETRFEEDQARIKVAVRVPDPSQAASVLHDWNSEHLEALSQAERREILERLDELHRQGQLAMAEGQDTFELSREGGGWRMALDWAAGVRVSFHPSVNAGVPVQAEVEHAEVASAPGEIFRVALKIKNTGEEQLVARIGHLVDPHELRDYLDLVECGFLLPVTLAPGKEELFTSTYLLRGNLPEGVRRLKVTYALTAVR